MNGKATVSKQLNEKHIKILEGLLKSPENRECADCKTRAPRWASVNLGVFICMQCSGIHRSLGVHISKVRSTTLDTWLPDQVAKMQAMGNLKSNAYWEAELPPNYDRIGIENFVRAKYIEKRWVSRDGKSYASAMAKEEVTSAYKSRSRSLDGHGHHNASQHSHQETKDFHSLPTEEVVLASTSRPGSSHSQRNSSGCQNQHQEKKYNHSPSRLGSSNSPRSIVPDLPKVSRLATTPGTAVDAMKTAEPRKPKVKTEVAEPMPISRPLEVDYGTELFMMLSSNNFAANDTNEPPSENNAWVKFESDEAIPSMEEKFLLEPAKSKTPFETSVQQNPKALVLSVQEPSHLHPKDMKRDHLSMQDNNQDPQKDMSGEPQDSQKDARKDLVSYPKYYTEEPQKDQKTNNQKTDVQSNMASNESIHHQRLALLVQDESVLNGPPAKPLPAPQIWLKQHQSHANGIHAPYTHGEDLKRGALRAQIEQSNHPKMQSTRPSSIARTMSGVAANSHPYAPSMYKPANPINGTANGAVKKQNPRLPVSPHDYDFSILTQGLFTKQ